MTTTDMQEAVDQVLRLRGVETPCETCHGMGVRTYPNTGTWRAKKGSVVGHSMTRDVCDACWGTGDAERHGVDLRKQQEEERQRVAAAALALIADKAGVTTGTMRPAIEALVKELEGLSKTKNKPRPPWFSLVCEQVAKALKAGVEAKP